MVSHICHSLFKRPILQAKQFLAFRVVHFDGQPIEFLYSLYNLVVRFLEFFNAKFFIIHMGLWIVVLQNFKQLPKLNMRT